MSFGINIRYANARNINDIMDEEPFIECKSREDAFDKACEYALVEAKEACAMENEPVSITIHPENSDSQHQVIIYYRSDNSYCFYDVVESEDEQLVLE